jgi:arylsulfatase A-like enzyme
LATSRAGEGGRRPLSFRTIAAAVAFTLIALFGNACRRPGASRVRLEDAFARSTGEIVSAADLFTTAVVSTLRPRRNVTGVSTDSVELTADFAAEDVDLVRVRVGGMLRGVTSLSWRRRGGVACAQCSVRASTVRPGKDGTAEVDFRVDGSGAWKGWIESLDIHCRVSDGTSRISGEALRFAGPRADLLKPTVAHPVDLGHDVRQALMSRLGDTVVIQVPPGEPKAFTFDAAVVGNLRDSFVLEVHGVTREGESESLKRVVLSEPDDWKSIEVPLEGRKWSAIRLALQRRKAAASRAIVVLWGCPRFVLPDPTPRPDIVLIVADTLRADRLSSSGYTRRTTPHLDRWFARHGTVFDDAVTAVPWTLPSHVSIFSGLYPMHHGVNFDGQIPNSVRLMAEYLEAAGYRTRAITGGGFVHPSFGFHRGFDEYSYFASDGFAYDDELSSDLTKAHRVLAGHEGAPLFLFFHTYEMHNPYSRREPWADQYSARSDVGLRTTRLGRDAADGFTTRMGIAQAGSGAPLPDGDLLRLASDFYDSELSYLDAQLSQILEEIDRRRAQGRETLVIFTSDHGESFGEHGLTNHGNLDESNLHIPLLVAPPGGRAGAEHVAALVRSIDLLPTVLSFAGIRGPSGLDGSSLAPALAGERLVGRTAISYAASTNFGIALEEPSGMKYVYRDFGLEMKNRRLRCFDLREDRGEDTDLCGMSDVLPRAVEAVLGDRLAHATGGLLAVQGGASGLSVAFDVEGLGPQDIKLGDRPCSHAAWTGSGKFEIRVESGSTCRLLLYTQSLGRMQVTSLAPGTGHEHPPSAAFDLRSSRAAVDCLTGREWRAVTNGAPRASERCVIWTPLSGRRGASVAGSKAREDEELRQSLEALGYLDN